QNTKQDAEFAALPAPEQERRKELRRQREEWLAKQQEAAEQRRLAEVAEAALRRQAEEEYDSDGLVLLKKSVQATSGDFSIQITGRVVNRRDRKLSYAQITFNLYDASGAQVGTALANINGLEPGGRWNFKAVGLEKAATYKFSELSGF